MRKYTEVLPELDGVLVNLVFS